jgi:AcrR family transcriptional regulator
VIATAMRLIERDGLEALTMRRLSEELGAAVTAIYWHVGNRDALLDVVVERTLAQVGAIVPVGGSPRQRIASLARQLRERLLDSRHLTALAHQRGKTPAMFQPIQAALAHELAELGLHGAQAALVLEAFQLHVTASVVLQRTAERGPTYEATDASTWGSHPDDPDLVRHLSHPVDHAAVFEYGLDALLQTLPRRVSKRIARA